MTGTYFRVETWHSSYKGKRFKQNANKILLLFEEETFPLYPDITTSHKSGNLDFYFVSSKIQSAFEHSLSSDAKVEKHLLMFGNKFA